MAGQIADCNIGEAWQVCSLGLVFLYDFVFHPRFKVLKPSMKPSKSANNQIATLAKHGRFVPKGVVLLLWALFVPFQIWFNLLKELPKQPWMITRASLAAQFS